MFPPHPPIYVRLYFYGFGSYVYIFCIWTFFVVRFSSRQAFFSDEPAVVLTHQFWLTHFSHSWFEMLSFLIYQNFKRVLCPLSLGKFNFEILVEKKSQLFLSISFQDLVFWNLCVCLFLVWAFALNILGTLKALLKLGFFSSHKIVCVTSFLFPLLPLSGTSVNKVTLIGPCREVKQERSRSWVRQAEEEGVCLVLLCLVGPGKDQSWHLGREPWRVSFRQPAAVWLLLE